MEYMVWIWLGVFLLAIIVESLTQELVSVWFAFGALIALILSAFPSIEWYIQLVVFTVVSILLLGLTRPFAVKLLKNSTRYTNIDEFVGKRVPVITEISKYNSGEVKLNDIIYHASLLEEETESIAVGQIVEIVTFKGNKVIVRKIESERKDIL